MEVLPMKKNFITGFIAGGIICAAITGFAVEYAVTANPFPVKVNGQAVQVEGYNINDNTYFKLRDVADAVGGFEVGFADNTITIDTGNAVKPEPTVVPMPIPSSEIPPQATELNPVFPPYYYQENGLTSDGIPILIDDNGNKYVSELDMNEVYHYVDYGYGFGTTSLYDADFNKILDNIPTVKGDPTYEYYETVLRPFFIEHCK